MIHVDGYEESFDVEEEKVEVIQDKNEEIVELNDSTKIIDMNTETGLKTAIADIMKILFFENIKQQRNDKRQYNRKNIH